MYMYFFLGYEMNQIADSFQRQEKADNTFLLALDGDVDFEPKAVVLLLDRMRRDFDVAAACGRIHPVGSGRRPPHPHPTPTPFIVYRYGT